MPFVDTCASAPTVEALSEKMHVGVDQGASHMPVDEMMCNDDIIVIRTETEFTGVVKGPPTAHRDFYAFTFFFRCFFGVFSYEGPQVLIL
jgi:hypothetical protein